MRVATWNVNGAKAAATQSELPILLENHDVVCLQEVKTKVVPQVLLEAGDRFVTFWTPCAYRASYAGTGLVVRRDWAPELYTHQALAPASDTTASDDDMRAHDREGRITAVRLTAGPWAGVVVVSVYAPNSGVDRKCPLKRLPYRTGRWDPDFAAYVSRVGGPVLVCGDLNVAARDHDVHNPKTLKKKAGYTAEERASFARHLGHLTDAWAALHPDDADDASRFTFFGGYHPSIKQARKGWRLDYQLSAGLKPLAARTLFRYDSSDHVPLSVTYDVMI